MNLWIRTLLVLLTAVFSARCASAPAERGPAADLVLRGGTVFLADPGGTTHQALAVRGDRIVAVGSDAEIAGHIGPETRVVELDGRLVTPGMNDAHIHFGPGGLSLLQVPLGGTTSLAEIEALVREAATEAEPGEWIEGRGWDHTRLPAEALGPGGWPTRAALDRAAPENPVYLRRVDGHVGWVNTRALELAGITAETPDPEGGEIVRDPATGEPTGILKEDAMDLVAEIVPEPSPARARRGIEAALERAAETGITSVQTEVNLDELAVYREMRDAGELTVRVYGWFPLSKQSIDWLASGGVTAPTGDEWVRIGLLKGYVDGTLGSRTAWMLEPFADDPSTRGIQRMSEEELDRLVRAADSAGLQLAIHAIGDGANRMVLDAIERAGATDGRHRIEHAQILDAADIPRFAELGVIASMQPTHATSDMRWAETRIGRERAEEGAYAWRSLIDAGATVAFGTDFAVEPMAPVEGLYSAVTRQSREEPGTPPDGWLRGERLTIEEAIRLYTATPAYAEFQEDVKGTLEPGKLADLVVWDRNLLTIPAVEILDAAPDLTVVGGRVVWEG